MKLIKFNVSGSRCGYGLPLIAENVTANIYCIPDQLGMALGTPSAFFALEDAEDKIKDIHNVRRSQFFTKVPEFPPSPGSVRGQGCNMYGSAKVLASKNFTILEEFNLSTHPFLYCAKVDLRGYGTRYQSMLDAGVILITAQDLYANQQGNYLPTVFYIKSPECLDLYVENEKLVQKTPIESLHANWDRSVMSLILNTILFPNKSVSMGSANLHVIEKYCTKSAAWHGFERTYFEVRNRYG
jgi:hypothetical protein